ncbi:hypothetical protein sm9_1314 [Methanobrevibacter millerae]|uniref:Adhesin-like protein n=2 Tax=Methanobrevibacter millerae TaxID=230361 RepID=A0A0U3E500_9EURY|nr:hypothetical protein sm9_1314 [Methanobrevibacter millerae]
METMKEDHIIISIILILIVIGVGITLILNESQQETETLDEYTTIIGNNSNGTVYKITYGNLSSNNTAIMILGVHSLENGTHIATNESIMNFTKDNTLKNRFVAYYIKLNFNDSGMNTSDYDTNRHMGELLANEYVVPDIENYDPYVVVDVHEMEDYWENQKYVGIINNESNVSVQYANEIAGNLSFPVFPITGGTSPEWVTIPISNNRHEVILFETAQDDSMENKTQIASNLVRTVDNFNVYK